MEPAECEAWYQTARGKWIADIEWKLLLDLMQPKAERLCSMWDVVRGISADGLPRSD